MLLKALATVFLCIIGLNVSYAEERITPPQENNTLPPPSVSQNIPAPPKLDVRAYLLMEYKSGRVLFGENIDEKIDPASLTKMMTSYVVGQEIKLGRLQPSDMVTISEKAWSKNYSDSSKMFIEVGKKVSVDMLNKGIIITSGNDACIAMAEHIAGTEDSFASLMNQWGKRIGLTNTNFVNSHGLYDVNHYSTAYDMAVLGRALIKDLPEEYSIYAQKDFEFNGITQHNRNRLLWDDSIKVDGIKTGHLSQVGYNLVASAINPQNGMRLISVVIGDVSEKKRAINSKALLQYGLRYYEPYTPLKANDKIVEKEIRLGMKDTISLGVPEEIYIAIPVGSKDRVKASFSLNNKQLLAPISKGDKLGKITISLDGKPLYKTDLIALEDVSEAGFFSKIWDYTVMTVSDWF
ncbi:MAG: serine hydrolase [Succinivibrionaceae bacterium]